MFKLDLKRAEVAIRSGRLDKAFDVLINSPQTNHADGQRLVEQLAADYVVRARLHLENDRLETAVMDAKKAEQLAGQRADVAELKANIAAKRLSLAGRARAVNSASAIEQLKAFVDANDHEGAMGWLAEHPAADGQRHERQQLAMTSARQMLQRVKDDFDNGRLDRCEANLDLLLAAGFQQQTLTEMAKQLERCRTALQHAREAQFGLAIEQLQLAAQIATGANWIVAAMEAISQCQDNLKATFAGPLGLLDQQKSIGAQFDEPQADQTQQIGSPIRQMVQSGNVKAKKQSDMEARREVLQVDQLGGVLLLPGSTVSVGTPSIAKSSDIVLQTEGLKAKIEICRDGEDYFASSEAGFFVSEVFAKHHVLSPGDVIAVGSRGRLKFVRPMLASNSAVLMVQGAKMKRRDIRGIVMVDESVVFGDSGCHFSVPDLPRRVIVRPANHGTSGTYVIHEKGATDRQLLNAGQTQSVAGVQFTLLPESSAPRERVS
jgi:tetratricopeptide (TPR) repeat protein